MTPALFKDLLREIKGSIGRYLSILLITALGVAFFAGIKASAPDMKNSADAYFDKYAMQDVQVFSTVGLDQEDIDAIKKISGVEAAQGQFTADFLVRNDSRELTIKVISFQKDQSLNKPRLVEGRMPKNEHECLAEMDSATGKIFGTFEIGDTIHLYSGTDDPLSDSLKTDTFTIVGKAASPNYLSYVHGSSSIGSGSIDTFFYIPQSAVAADYYTEVDIAIEGAREMDTYSQAYFDTVEPVVDEVEQLADSRSAKWKQEQLKKIDDEQQKLDDELAKARLKLDNASKELSDSKNKLDDAQKTIEDNEALLASTREQLDAGYIQASEGRRKLEAGLQAVNDGIAQIEEAQKQRPSLVEQKTALQNAVASISQIDTAISGIQTLSSSISALQAQISALEKQNPDDPSLPALKSQLEALQTQMNALLAAANLAGSDPAAAIAALEIQKNSILPQIGGSVEAANASIAAIDTAIASIDEAAAKLPQLQTQKQQLIDQLSALRQSEQSLAKGEAAYQQGLSALNSGKNELEEGNKAYSDGKAEYEKGLDDYSTQQNEAQKKIDDARKEIQDLEVKWIVLDRNSHYSYKDYEACAERMDGIASVFPVFFFLVAALVCMTTMTRMVDEDRGEMGTLKALGYSRWQIAAKYLIYAGSASIFGSILGCAVGMYVFPMIIYSAWNIMYNLEAIQFKFQPGLMILASASVTGVVLLAAFFSISRELREVPAQLMRPKAAKAGKRILLERVNWFWSKLSFMHKVTLRNLFRYKKRFFMTVVGIAGCSALLLAGFGLNDSISDIVPRQFEAIYHYDASVTTDESDGHPLADDLAKENGVIDTFALQTLPITVHYDGKDVSGTLNIVDDPKAFESFMTFIPMNGTKDPSLKQDGALVAVKTAEKLGLSVGDTLVFKTADDQQVEVPVSGIFEQYTGHMVYVSEKTFQTLGIKENPDAEILLISEGITAEEESELGSRIMEHDGIRSVTFYSATIDNFENMISSIKMVVAVLVLSAAMLAFVVLYNLSNVNISERMREIATIKVLGFTEKEVNAYINRESILLAIIGAAVGLLLGIYLHDLIMNLAELDTIRFGRTIFWQSYVYSFGLTMLFTLMVNWIMKRRLRKIEMVESLKAVE